MPLSTYIKILQFKTSIEFCDPQNNLITIIIPQMWAKQAFFKRESTFWQSTEEYSWQKSQWIKLKMTIRQIKSNHKQCNKH